MSDYSEIQLMQAATELAKLLKAGDRVLLEGPMGVGKSTFARALLGGLNIRQPSEGSPTFAIAHEYSCPQGGVVHIDYYRIRNAQEIEEAGIPAYYWERNLIIVSEWLSSWPNFEKLVLLNLLEGQAWRVNLNFSKNSSTLRQLSIQAM